MNKKRTPIRRRVQRIVHLVALITLLLTRAMSIFSLVSIRRQSREALTKQLEENLLNSISDKAALANAEFVKFRGSIEAFASGMRDMYLHPGYYLARMVRPPRRENAGVLTMQIISPVFQLYTPTAPVLPYRASYAVLLAAASMVS